MLISGVEQATGASRKRTQDVVGRWIKEVTRDKPYGTTLQPFQRDNLAFNFFLTTLMNHSKVQKKQKVPTLAADQVGTSCHWTAVWQYPWTPWLMFTSLAACNCCCLRLGSVPVTG